MNKSNVWKPRDCRTSKISTRRIGGQNQHHPIVLGPDSGAGELRAVEVLRILRSSVVCENQSRNQFGNANRHYNPIRGAVHVDLALLQELWIVGELRRRRRDNVAAAGYGGAVFVFKLVCNFISKTICSLIPCQRWQTKRLSVTVKSLNKIIFVICTQN